MSAIMQGTTPSLKITISTDDFLLTDVTAIELKVKNRTVWTYTADDLIIDTEENSITKVFTVEETASLSTAFDVVVQGRFWFADGSVVGINKITLSVADMLGV